MLLTVSGGLNSFVQFLTVLLIFIFVLLLTYFTTRWTANYQKGKLCSKNLEVVETFKLTANKYVQIVRAGEKYLAIAICKDSVTLLTELEREELILQEPGAEAGTRFKEVLDKAKAGRNKK